MKLYEISWGIYPRRIGVYIAEKGIVDIERVDIPVTSDTPSPILGDLTPCGTVPALETDHNGMIGSSIAILEYLEECFPEPNLLGKSAIERARTREVVAVIDEATVHMGGWVRNASPLFANRVPQNPAAAITAAAAYERSIRLLNKYAAASGDAYLAGGNVTIADCIAFSAIQFANEVYSVPLPEDCVALRSWYDRFAKRPSAAVPAYPANILAIACGLPSQTARIQQEALEAS